MLSQHPLLVVHPALLWWPVWNILTCARVVEIKPLS